MTQTAESKRRKANKRRQKPWDIREIPQRGYKFIGWSSDKEQKARKTQSVEYTADEDIALCYMAGKTYKRFNCGRE